MPRDTYNSAKNIIVGASPLFINQAAYDGDSNLDPTKGADKVAFSSAASYITSLNAATTKWRNVGYTNNGLQITYNPTYGNVTVDQLLDSAKLFKESMEVMLATELAEGTLENILVVFGQPGGTAGITEGGAGAAAFDGDSAAPSGVLLFTAVITSSSAWFSTLKTASADSIRRAVASSALYGDVTTSSFSLGKSDVVSRYGSGNSSASCSRM